MKPSVYIETTIPSYYHDQRPSLAMHIARTRTWWDQERHDYDCFVSEVVMEELAEGDYPGKALCLAFVADLSRVPLNGEIREIADTYCRRQLMPRWPVRDALHVAIASYHGIDFLLTWNCTHLANANKFARLEKLNRELGIIMPRIITPLELQPWKHDE